MSSEAVEGGCFCGAVRYRGTSQGRGAHCHCSDCRRSSGAPFLTWLMLDAEDFAFTKGSPGVYESRNDAGLQVRRKFCAACGTQLTYERPDEPEAVVITVCSLDEPQAVAPTEHIWTTSQLAWIRLDDGLPRHHTEPPPE